MSKVANPGELRTKVFFVKNERLKDREGNFSDKETNVFGAGVPCMCKWVNAHGNEVFQTMQLEIREPATITTRYSAKLLDPKMIVYKADDPMPFEIISIDNVEEKNKWLEIKVQRESGAR